MKLTHISDKHGLIDLKRFKLPKCDVLIDSGDLTNVGEIEQIIETFEWYRSLDCHVIFVAGNHDRSFDQKFMRKYNREDIYKQVEQLIKDLPENVHYLENQEIIIGGVKFWGSPVTPDFHPENWAFNKPRGREIADVWSKIPEDVQVLITHGPPFGIMDATIRGVKTGCGDLLNKIDCLTKLKFHMFGHIHEAFGVEEYNDVVYSNGSILNEQYRRKNEPNVFEI